MISMAAPVRMPMSLMGQHLRPRLPSNRDRAIARGGYRSFSAAERVARVERAFGETASEPFDALRGCTVREAIGHHAPRGHALQTVVANRGRRVEPSFDVARLQLHLVIRRASRLRRRVP